MKAALKSVASTPASVTKNVTMKHKKSTKGTHVYESEDPLCKQVYLGKEALGENAPATITLSVTFAA